MSNVSFVISQIRGCFGFRKNLRSLWGHETSRYAALDGIRALSILMVIFFHALVSVCSKMSREDFQVFLEGLPWFMRWLMQGDKSVEMFFVLSGFLIGCMLMKEGQRSAGRLDYKSFYWRRLLRLSPAYWILLLLILLAPMDHNKAHLWYYLFYLQNFLPGDELLAGWAWTLAVEEQFYLILPLLLSLFFFRTRYKLTFLVLLFLSSFPIRYFIVINNPEFTSQSYVDLMYNSHYFGVLYDNLYTRYGGLVAGVIAAYLHCYHKEDLQRFFSNRAMLANTLHAVAIVLLFWMINLAVYSWNGPDYVATKTLLHVFGRHVMAICTAYIMLACLYGDGFTSGVRWFLSWRIWLLFSQMAYGLYLFHPILTLFAEEVVNQSKVDGEMYTLMHLLAIGVITIVVSMIFCFFTYMLVEKPFMNMRDIKLSPDLSPDKEVGESSAQKDESAKSTAAPTAPVK